MAAVVAKASPRVSASIVASIVSDETMHAKARSTTRIRNLRIHRIVKDSTRKAIHLVCPIYIAPSNNGRIPTVVEVLTSRFAMFISKKNVHGAPTLLLHTTRTTTAAIQTTAAATNRQITTPHDESHDSISRFGCCLHQIWIVRWVPPGCIVLRKRVVFPSSVDRQGVAPRNKLLKSTWDKTNKLWPQ